MAIDGLAKRFNGVPDIVLSVALLLAAAVLVVLALAPISHWFKALALAYVILP